jgi:hypothetical protein
MRKSRFFLCLPLFSLHTHVLQRAECPDPPRCQMLLDDKWRQANLAICRYGPPQPSVAFICLRQLETLPTNPSLVMPHPLCQATAKEWIKSCKLDWYGLEEWLMIVFDRMFQFRSINSPLSPGTEKVGLVLLVGGVSR